MSSLQETLEDFCETNNIKLIRSMNELVGEAKIFEVVAQGHDSFIRKHMHVNLVIWGNLPSLTTSSIKFHKTFTYFRANHVDDYKEWMQKDSSTRFDSRTLLVRTQPEAEMLKAWAILNTNDLW